MHLLGLRWGISSPHLPHFLVSPCSPHMGVGPHPSRFFALFPPSPTCHLYWAHTFSSGRIWLSKKPPPSIPPVCKRGPFFRPAPIPAQGAYFSDNDDVLLRARKSEQEKGL
ncbi:hypothetical protein BX070DRAFT_226245 [Coemansia spiralis]|nr:hypothetical protein BX070DRAFT_226245 [Coemansia spiralis]